MNSQTTKNALFDSLVDENNATLKDLIQDIFLERLQQKAYNIFEAEMQRDRDKLGDFQHD